MFLVPALQDYANSVTGRIGNLTYAVQGNILTGACVIAAAESAIRNSDGDIPQLLMDSLQAAKEGGGDGRCSCSSSGPTRCGCPPPSFTKSGHVGFMLSARANDTDDPRYASPVAVELALGGASEADQNAQSLRLPPFCSCDPNGCARGVYYLDLNVADQSSSRPDPVDQLQELFDAWRQTNSRRPY